MKYLFLLIWLFFWVKYSFAAPNIPELWMPFDGRSPASILDYSWWEIVMLAIRYVAVVAVLALMLSWIMYLIAWWEEEKVKKAKSWIMWSLIWVLLSISAWGIINFINSLRITTGA